MAFDHDRRGRYHHFRQRGGVENGVFRHCFRAWEDSAPPIGPAINFVSVFEPQDAAGKLVARNAPGNSGVKLREFFRIELRDCWRGMEVCAEQQREGAGKQNSCRRHFHAMVRPDETPLQE